MTPQQMYANALRATAQAHGNYAANKPKMPVMDTTPRPYTGQGGVAVPAPPRTPEVYHPPAGSVAPNPWGQAGVAAAGAAQQPNFAPNPWQPAVGAAGSFGGMRPRRPAPVPQGIPGSMGGAPPVQTMM
jgi:hypothetical protein